MNTKPSPSALPPFQLWIGDRATLNQEVHRYLITLLCPNNGCFSCSTCTNITNHQHHSLLWIEPEKTYTLDTIHPIIHALSFALDEAEHFFLILMNIDDLSNACANALLKSLEEPPRGYHFIACATNKQSILPTIISRAVIYEWHHESSNTLHRSLFDHFTFAQILHPNAFLNTLETSKINEHESKIILDNLLTFWSHESIVSLHNHEKKERYAQLIAHALKKPIPSGSSKLFWKNLYLQFQQISPS